MIVGEQINPCLVECLLQQDSVGRISLVWVQRNAEHHQPCPRRVRHSGVVLPVQVLGGVGDGCSGGRSSTHVRDTPQGVDGGIFGGVVEQAELHPLVVGELHGTWTSNTQSVSQSDHQLIN